MPNKCIKCGFIFNENTNLLKGCPFCNGKKFSFVSNKCLNKKILKEEHHLNKNHYIKDSFESLKILNKGSYELNLDLLFKKKDFIVELIEEGKYIIDLPSLLKKNKR